MEAKSTNVGRVALVMVASLLVAMMWAFLTSSPAQAQAEPYSSQTPEVLPTRITNPPENPPENRNPEGNEDDVGAGGEQNRPQSGVLPFTGGDVVLFVVIGAAAVGAGFVLVRRTRHQN